MHEVVWINWHSNTVVRQEPSSLECSSFHDGKKCKGWQKYEVYLSKVNPRGYEFDEEYGMK